MTITLSPAEFVVLLALALVGLWYLAGLTPPRGPGPSADLGQLDQHRRNSAALRRAANPIARDDLPRHVEPAGASAPASPLS